MTFLEKVIAQLSEQFPHAHFEAGTQRHEPRICPDCGRRTLHVAVNASGETLLSVLWIPLPHCRVCGDQSPAVLAARCRHVNADSHGHNCANPETPPECLVVEAGKPLDVTGKRIAVGGRSRKPGAPQIKPDKAAAEAQVAEWKWPRRTPVDYLDESGQVHQTVTLGAPMVVRGVATIWLDGFPAAPLLRVSARVVATTDDAAAATAGVRQ